MIKINLAQVGINREYASFIDLDITQTLDLEIKLHIQKLMSMDESSLRKLSYRDLYLNGGFYHHTFHQKRGAGVNEDPSFGGGEFFNAYCKTAIDRAFAGSTDR